MITVFQLILVDEIIFRRSDPATGLAFVTLFSYIIFLNKKRMYDLSCQTLLFLIIKLKTFGDVFFPTVV